MGSRQWAVGGETVSRSAEFAEPRIAEPAAITAAATTSADEVFDEAIAELFDAAIALDSASGVQSRAAAPLVEEAFVEEFVAGRLALPQSNHLQRSRLTLSDVGEVAGEDESSGESSDEADPQDRWLSDELLEVVFG